MPGGIRDIPMRCLSPVVRYAHASLHAVSGGQKPRRGGHARRAEPLAAAPAWREDIY